MPSVETREDIIQERLDVGTVRVVLEVLLSQNLGHSTHRGNQMGIVFQSLLIEVD